MERARPALREQLQRALRWCDLQRCKWAGLKNKCCKKLVPKNKQQLRGTSKPTRCTNFLAGAADTFFLTSKGIFASDSGQGSKRNAPEPDMRAAGLRVDKQRVNLGHVWWVGCGQKKTEKNYPQGCFFCFLE